MRLKYSRMNQVKFVDYSLSIENTISNVLKAVVLVILVSNVKCNKAASFLCT